MAVPLSQLVSDGDETESYIFEISQFLYIIVIIVFSAAAEVPL